MVPENSSTSCRWHLIDSTIAACTSGPFPALRSRSRTPWVHDPIWSSYARSPPLHGDAELHPADFNATLNWIRYRAMSADDLKTISILILDYWISAGFTPLWQQLCTFHISAVFNPVKNWVKLAVYLWFRLFISDLSEKSGYFVYSLRRVQYRYWPDEHLILNYPQTKTSICFIFM